MAYADDITITSTHTSTRNIYNHTYIEFCLDKTKQSHTKSRQINLHSGHPRPCRKYEQSGPQNKQHCTAHGNAHKGSGHYLRPKTHIQRTHSQHLSTSTQATTKDIHLVSRKIGLSPLAKAMGVGRQQQRGRWREQREIERDRGR